jgi:putative type II site-specific deoxyribonuclease
VHTFEQSSISRTIDNLIKGEDYRKDVIASINVAFFDFCLDFFKKVLNAKLNAQVIDLSWYKANFINDASLSVDELLNNSGLNKKTVTNIYETARKTVALNIANDNIDYLESLLLNIDNGDINISINLTYNNISVSLNLSESLIVINALATKKMAIRGGAWSAIGKRVEKPLIDKLCDLSGVPIQNRNNETFVKNKELDFDREVDYKLISNTGKIYRIEVKLMGKGNPESADATIARDSDIFVADTLSEQNKRQLKARNVEYLELKNNRNVIYDFKSILTNLDIPFSA